MKKIMLAVFAGVVIVLLGSYFFPSHHKIYIKEHPTINEKEEEKICKDDLFSARCRDFARNKLHQQIYQLRKNKDGLNCWLPYDEKSWYYNPECIKTAK